MLPTRSTPLYLYLHDDCLRMSIQASHSSMSNPCLHRLRPTIHRHHSVKEPHPAAAICHASQLLMAPRLFLAPGLLVAPRLLLAPRLLQLAPRLLLAPGLLLAPRMLLAPWLLLAPRLLPHAIR